MECFGAVVGVWGRGFGQIVIAGKELTLNMNDHIYLCSIVAFTVFLFPCKTLAGHFLRENH